MKTAIVGVDDRMDANGNRHPWRIVARVGTKTHALLVALPKRPFYLQIPRHPIYGDLTETPSTLPKDLPVLADILAEMGCERVIMAITQEDSSIARTFEWSGMAVDYVDIEYEGDLREDAFSIGGDAGHEITIIERCEGNAQ